MTYLVMQTEKSYCIVLDEAGRFKKAANFHYEVGQTLDEIHELTASSPRFTLRHLSAFAATIAAAVLFFFALQFYQGFMTPFASVYLQINPEVRIDVNRNDRVIGLEAINEDGKDLLEGYDAKRQDLEVVTDELIDLAIAKGYLADGGALTIRLDAPNEEWFLEKGITLRRNLNEYLEEKVSVTIRVVEYSQEEPYTPPRDNPPGEDAGDVTPEPYPTPAMPSEEDSADDDDGDSDYESEYAAPSENNSPPPVYDDSGYDDSEYDDSGYDDSDYDD